MSHQQRGRSADEAYTPGRAWHVTHEDGTVTHGRAATLATAMKAAIADLLNLPFAARNL